MGNNLWVVVCMEDFGDGESGPMPVFWREYYEDKDVGEAWIREQNARPATEKEKAGYEAYKREVRKFKELGIDEDYCPFSIEDFIEEE